MCLVSHPTLVPSPSQSFVRSLKKPPRLPFSTSPPSGSPHAFPFPPLPLLALLTPSLFHLSAFSLSSLGSLSSSSSSASRFSSSRHSERSREDDHRKANLVRFPLSSSSEKRGWLLDPASVGIQGAGCRHLPSNHEGTAECDKYWKQIETDRLSKLVFSPTDKENGDRRKFAVVAKDRIFDKVTSSENPKELFDPILHQPKNSDAVENFDYEAIP
ncbi:uncharacterized protein LOC130135202 [Syzygium oleosum]|uniref:uncharacterized protein LOC130135202 n=1 Tax=Syzygium oleosum TaxID=219896 RepID=UPI0024BBB3B8|nr:uncharacterized protein LOC130135202 [Syzygium oleosum]